MEKVRAFRRHAGSRGAPLVMAALLAWLMNDAAAAEGSSAAPVPDDGKCTIEISLQTTPAFSERLPCHYSNYPVFKSDRLIWNTPKTAAGVTASPSAGKATADSATIILKDDRIASTDSAGAAVLTPRAGHAYELDSSSKITWSGVVDLAAPAADPAPVECAGGTYGSNLPPVQYVAGTKLKLNWSSVDPAGDVVHGAVEALLSCARIHANGSRTALGLIGKATIRF